jgi:hypothetical protein
LNNDTVELNNKEDVDNHIEDDAKFEDAEDENANN